MNKYTTVAGIAGPQKSRPAAGANGRRGRSAEFRQYMEQLYVIDPERWALINAEESKFVAVVETQLAADEQVIADQMEGWADDQNRYT